jgi:hypothetical protein
VQLGSSERESNDAKCPQNPLISVFHELILSGEEGLGENISEGLAGFRVALKLQSERGESIRKDLV